VDRDIVVKNAPLTVLEELAQIRGFTASILMGGDLEEFYDRPDITVTGILPTLTVYGDDRLQLNSVSEQVLMTVSGLRRDQVEDLLERRLGLDGLPGTEDDGFVNVDQALSAAGIPAEISGQFTVSGFQWVRIQSVARVGEVVRVVECVYEFDGRNFTLQAYGEFSP
jgi:hypothetical protein